MGTQHQEQRTPHDRSEGDLDESMEESFPASDPPAIGGATRIEPGNGNKPGEQPKENKPGGEQPGKQPGGSEAEEGEDDDEKNDS